MTVTRRPDDGQLSAQRRGLRAARRSRPTSAARPSPTRPVSAASGSAGPHGHVAFQAPRGDVEAALVGGRVVERDHRLVGVDLAAVRRTVEHLRAELGDEAREAGVNPDVPETALLDNPYTYTDYRSASTHGG